MIKNNRIYRIKAAMIALLILIPVLTLFPGGNGAPADFSATPFPEALEEYVRRNMPLSAQLSKLGVRLRYLGGKREQNDVFFGNGRLIRNIAPPDKAVAGINTAAVLELASYLRDINVPFYFTLIPTASGILRQFLPSHAQVYDQRRMIDNCYSEMVGKLVTVDTYLSLNANREQYLYYRTEDNLTSYGGYYVYAALAKRMGVTDNPSYNAFGIRYSEQEYYGSLYRAFPHEGITPDSLILYVYSRHVREYIVTHSGPEGVNEKTYHTLYPEHLRDMGAGTDIYLGGLSAVTDIRVSSPYDRKLLVLGDKTAQAYLPFLVNHYKQVVFVDMSYNEDLYAHIRAEDFDQVLMAYSVETYVSPENTPSRAALFIED